MSGEEVEIHARQYVSAAGQWATSAEQSREWCRLSKGIHLVMPALPSNEAILLTSKKDGRVFFIIPWYGRTLLGTTDTDYHGDIQRVVVEDYDVDYLLSAANHYLKTHWAKKDVIGSYAGLRILKQSDAEHPSTVSRDWELKTASNRLLHIIGGKLTSAREDASVVVDAVCAHLGLAKDCTTKDKDFPWKPPMDFGVWSAEMLAQAQHIGIDAESAKWLMRRHGVRVEQVFRLAEENSQMAERIVPDLPFIHADLQLCARDEMIVHLSDLLRRRMPLLILARMSTTEIRRLAELVAPIMSWDAARIEQEINACCL